MSNKETLNLCLSYIEENLLMRVTLLFTLTLLSSPRLKGALQN